jgi:cysteine desulfurase
MNRTAIYLDHAATTPVDPSVLVAMQRYFTETFGNAGSVHQFGQAARGAVDEARVHVARLIGAQPKEIVFTSGATESNNAAILGTVYAHDMPGRHVITAATEHHAVLEPCRWLAARGVEVTILPVDHYGVVDPDMVRRAIRPETVLITIMRLARSGCAIAEIGGSPERGVRSTGATQASASCRSTWTG